MIIILANVPAIMGFSVERTARLKVGEGIAGHRLPASLADPGRCWTIRHAGLLKRTDETGSPRSASALCCRSHERPVTSSWVERPTGTSETIETERTHLETQPDRLCRQL